MLQANIADFKSHLSEYLQKVQAGEELQICKRNVPFARVLPFPEATENRTVIGCGRHTARIGVDLTEPAYNEEDWEMHGAGK